MRTQGDDVAEALAFSVSSRWNPQSRRIDGVEPIALAELGRPRIDVTLRISGFFRDAFPHLITLIDDAVRLVVATSTSRWTRTFLRKHYLADLEKPTDLSLEDAEEQALFRIFGTKPGSYGVGLSQLIDTGHWRTTDDLAKVFLEWGGYAYGRNTYGGDARTIFADRLKTVQVALHNQDNREHDIFDSDDYYQFHGGMVATIRSLTGERPKAYFGDSARPETSRIRDLREEALRVYRSRVVNPKWIASIQRHGYKGGLELTATVDYIFGFDAAAEIAPDFVYEGLAEHYALDETMQAFLEQANPWAPSAIAKRAGWKLRIAAFGNIPRTKLSRGCNKQSWIAKPCWNHGTKGLPKPFDEYPSLPVCIDRRAASTKACTDAGERRLAAQCPSQGRQRLRQDDCSSRLGRHSS